MKSLLSQPWININALERAIGASRGTLEAYVAGRRGLSKHHREAIQVLMLKFTEQLKHNWE